MADEIQGLNVLAFGRNVRRLRQALVPKLNGKGLAAALNTDPGVVSKWENGRTGLPEGPMLIRLAKTLRVPVGELIGGVDDDYDAMVRALVPPEGVADKVGEAADDSAPAHGRTPAAHADRAGSPPPESDLLSTGTGRLSHAEEENLATAREAIERILAELTTVAERLPRRQAAVDRRGGPGGPPRARRTRRPLDRKHPKKAKSQ